MLTNKGEQNVVIHFIKYIICFLFILIKVNGAIINNHYYLLYENCDNDLKQHFIKDNGEPLLYRDGVGQYDAQNNLLREFVCKYDCIRKLCISDKTLAKTLDKNIHYNSFYYKSIGSKLHC